MTGIQIGKAVKAMLAASSDIVSAVGTKIFPIVSKEGTTYPFIVYRRGAIDVEYTKDGKASETVSVDIVVAATSYATAADIADKVRTAIDNKGVEYTDNTNTLKVRGTRMVTADEDFFEDSNVYTQTLNFNFYL